MTHQAHPPIIANTNEVKTVSLGPNRVAFLLRGEQTAGHYSLTEFTIAPPPAPGPPMHIHKAEDKLTYVLEGEIEFIFVERSERASVGSFFLVSKGTPHTLRSLGAGAARILVVLTPPGFESYWEEAAQLLEASKAGPDPAHMREVQEKYNMDAGGQVRRFSKENYSGVR
jgi:quercetin dioxygenase-like cupin family protein